MTDKNPIDRLRKEHEEVLQILNELEKNMKNRDIGLLEKNITSLDKEFSRHSLEKEEKVLFPEIEKFIPREGGPTGVMVMEHRELVNYIKSFKENIKSRDFERMNKSGGNILSILRPHIDKENNILFMMAEMHLSSEQKKAISEKFKKLDSGKG